MQKNLRSKNDLKLVPWRVFPSGSLLQGGLKAGPAKQKLLFLLFFVLPWFSLQAQTTYTWTGATNTTFGTATNWSPQRLSPASTDILEFTSGATVTGVTGGAIAQLHISGGTVTLQSSSTATITINGTTGVDFTIASGSTLNLGSTAANLTIAFGSANAPTGTIDGTLILANTGATIRNIFTATNAVITVNGSVENAGTMTSAAANLLFESGSSYTHKATTYAGLLPTATWKDGSKTIVSGYTTHASTVTNTGQSFYDFTWDCTQTGSPSFNASTMTVRNAFTLEKGNLRISGGTATNFVVKDFTMNAGTLDFYSSTSTTLVNTLKVSGKFTQAGGTITETGSSPFNTIEFNGSANQDVSLGTISNTINYKISNDAGINLTGTLAVNNGAALTIASRAATPVTGGAISYGISNTTLVYAAVGPLTATADVFPASSGPVNLTTNVTGIFPDNTLTIPFNCTVTGTLTMTTGNIDMGGNMFTLGASAAAPGTLTYTAGSFLNGSFMRYLGTGAIASGAAAGRFPMGYVLNGALYDRSLYLDHTGTLASGGLVGVTYNNVTGTTGITPSFTDGTLDIDHRLNSNWDVYQAGLSLGGNTMNMSVQGTGFPVEDYTTLILMHASGAAGTAVANTGSNSAPKVIRAFTSESDLSNTFYIGSESTYNSFAPVITAVRSGDWGDVSTWDTGTVPTSANNVIIPAGLTVTLASPGGGGPFTYECASLTLNGTTSELVGNDNTLRLGRTGGHNKTLTVNGKLTLGGGNINLNGNLILNTGATFNMSAGNLIIDGNDGVSQSSSVASGTNLFDIAGNITSNVTGGNITFVDPPFAGAGYAFRYNGTTNLNWSGNTMKFGDGVSSTTGAVNGFEVNTFNNGGRLALGDVIINGNGGTGLSATRLVTVASVAGKAFNIGGNLTINANSELRTMVVNGSPLTVGGNLTNNGAFVSVSALELNLLNAATSSAQTISGSGTFRNNNDPAAATANLHALTINNTNATGVTIDVANLLVRNIVTMTSGRINLGNNDLIISEAGSVSGTGSATNMFVINGSGKLKKKFNTGASSFNFPVGEMTGTPEYTPVNIFFTGNSVIRTVGVTVTNAAHPNLTSNGTQNDYIDRYWTISNDNAGGTYSYYGTFRYTADDIHGTEANMKVNRWNGSSWAWSTSSAASNLLTITSAYALTETTGPLDADFTGRVEPATTYTWNGSSATNPTNYQDPLNWTPNRNTPANDDVLSFDNGISNTVTNVNGQTIGKLILSNSTSVSLNPTSAAATLIIGGGTGTDLDIAANSTLSLAGTGSNVMTLAFTTGATTSVSGTLLNAASNNITFTSGVTNIKNGGIFHNQGNTTGSSTLNLIVEAGATYRHDKDGGGIATATFDNASTVEVLGIVNTTATFPTSLGNLIWNCPNQVVANASLSSLGTVNGNLTVISTGPSASPKNVWIPSTFTINGDLNQSGGIINLNNSTSNTTLNLKKALNQTGGTMTVSSTGVPTIAFNGTANQAVTLASNGITSKVNYTINNTGGITVTGTLPVNNGATLTITNAGSGAITGTVTYTGTTTLSYNATAAQTATTVEFPITNGPTNVSVNNVVTLTGGHRSIEGTLNLTTASGILKLGSCNLTFGANAPTTTNYNGTTSYILQDGTGRLFKVIPAGSMAQFGWPVAIMNGGSLEYSAASFAFPSNTVQRTIGVEVTHGTHSNMNANGTPKAYINHYYTFTDSEAGNGAYTYNMQLRFLASDTVGDINTLKVNRWDGTAWRQVTGTVDVTNPITPLLRVTPDQTNVSCPLGGSSFTGRVNPSSAYVWNGSTDNDWFKATNWTPNGNPTGSDSVVINNASATYQPLLSSTGGPVSIKSLTLTDGSLMLGANASLAIDGIFTYAAPAATNFDCSSTFIYAGSSAQTIYDLSYGNLISSSTGARTLANGTIGVCGSFTPGTNTYTIGSSTIDFNGTGAQTIPAFTYNNLTISGVRTVNNVTLASGTITVGGIFNPTANFTTGTFVPGTGTVSFNSALLQTIPAFNYYNLTASGGNRTLPGTGTVKIAGTFTAGTGTYTVAGSTVEFNGTAAQTIPALTVASGGNYNKLTVSGTGTYTFGATMTLDGDFTQSAGTVVVMNSSTAKTIRINGDFSISGGSFIVVNSSATSGYNWVYVGTVASPKNLNITGSGSINLEATGSPSSAGVLVVSGNFYSNTSATNALDFGGGSGIGANQVQIGGDLTMLGAGRFYTTSTTTTGQPGGVVFTKTGTQTFTSAAGITHSKTSFTVNAGSTVVLASDLPLTGNYPIPATQFNVSGILDMAGYTITCTTCGTNATNTFTVNAGGKVKTSHASGLNGAATGFFNRTFNTGADLEFTGSSAITNTTFPAALRNLTVSNSSTVTLGSNINVNGALTMNNGVLQTETNKVIMGSSASVVETNGYVKGIVESATDMNAAGDYSFNGIGLKLSPQVGSTNFPGVTTVRRITGSSVVAPNGNRSITRKFEIVPTVNQDLNVNIEFSYQDHELETLPGTFIDENNLVFFKSVDGNAPWAPRNYSSRNVAANTVTLNAQKDFSVWTLGDINAPLPVEIVYFGAKKVGSNVEVTWTTAVEKDSRGFEVEVSANGKDFRKLGFVESRNGNSLQQYSFTDMENGKTGIRYYRLKQIDLDGTTAFYGPKTVRFDAEKLQLTAYPNPFEREVNLNISAVETGKVMLKISDLTGKTILEQQVNVQKGTNKLLIGLDENLPAGVYQLQAQFGTEQVISRLLKR